MNILVDTSVWSAALRRDSASETREIRRLRAGFQGGDGRFTTGLIVQELLQGFSAPKSRDKILEPLLPFRSSPRNAMIILKPPP